MGKNNATALMDKLLGDGTMPRASNRRAVSDRDATLKDIDTLRQECVKSLMQVGDWAKSEEVLTLYRNPKYTIRIEQIIRGVTADIKRLSETVVEINRDYERLCSITNPNDVLPEAFPTANKCMAFIEDFRSSIEPSMLSVAGMLNELKSG